MEGLEEAIRTVLVEGKLWCMQAFAIADKNGLAPRSVGEEATRLRIKVSCCQLGLFGYDDRRKRRAVKPVEQASIALKEAITARLVAGKIPCTAAFEIASKQTISNLDVAAAIEALGLRVSDCRLGCFK